MQLLLSPLSSFKLLDDDSLFDSLFDLRCCSCWRARKMFQLAMIFFFREEKNSEKNFRAEKSFFRRNKVLFRAEKVAKLFSALLLYVRQQGFGGKMRKKVLQFFPHGTKFCSAWKKLFSGGKKICINFMVVAPPWQTTTPPSCAILRRSHQVKKTLTPMPTIS
jgi:hypothetical protein